MPSVRSMAVDRWRSIRAPDVTAWVEAASEATITPASARTAIGLVDLTTLSGTDTADDVKRLCARALSPGPGMPACAAVCVFPALVPAARSVLPEHGRVRLATVAGAFPHGQLPLHLRLAEVKWCAEHGVDEIDMVISRGRFLEGDLHFIHDEIAAHIDAAAGKHVKVILETGELPDLDAVAVTSRIALEAGADFLKTSTGKISPAATLQVTAVMLAAIAAFEAETGHAVGIKPAGGLRTADDAAAYMALVEMVLGAHALTAHRVRFGASSLLGALVDAAG